MTSPQTDNRNFPQITYENVRATLDSLVHLYSNVGRENPLEGLLLVDQALKNSDLPSSPFIRSFVLKHTFILIITNEFTRLRRILGMAVPPPDETLEEAQSAIIADTKTTNKEFIGWSLLYYVYIRVDLHLTLLQLASIAYLDARTLRRYQQHAVHRLTELLIKLEWGVLRESNTNFQNHLRIKLSAF